jgi:hypothetical protein
MSWKEKLDECTHSGKYHWITCWGGAHTLGVLALMTVVLWVAPPLLIPSAVVGCGVTLVHEGKGPGDLLNSTDRILDWLLPIIAAVTFVIIFQ